MQTSVISNLRRWPGVSFAGLVLAGMLFTPSRSFAFQDAKPDEQPVRVEKARVEADESDEVPTPGEEDAPERNGKERTLLQRLGAVLIQAAQAADQPEFPDVPVVDGPVFVETAVVGGLVAGEQPAGGNASETSEARKKLLEKLREPVSVRINNVSLKAAMEKLAKEHEFQFRFDADGLKEAKVDIEKAQVGVNLRRRPLVGVLREILGSHNLRLAVDEGEVVITSRPPAPAGVKRKKVADNVPVERVVLGNIVVSDKKDDAEANQAKAAVIQGNIGVLNVGALPNDAATKQMRDQQRAQFKQQFQMALRTEVALSLHACKPTPEQRIEIRKAAEKAFEEAGDKWVDIQVRMMRGWNGQPPKYPNIKEAIQAAITATVEKLLPADAVAAYKKEVDARIEYRKKATIANLVSLVDRNVVLSDEQRTKLTAQMAKHWSANWSNALEYMQWDGNNVFPNMPAECMDSVLNETQKKVWAGVQKMDPSQFWGGGGFGFFNAQIALDVEVGGEVGGAVQVIQLENGVVVDAAVEVKVAVPDEKPADEKPAEEKPK